MYKLLAVLIALASSLTVSLSQVNVIIQNVPPQYNVVTDEFPLLKVNVRVSDGSNQLELGTNNFFILEGAMVCEPFEVSPVQNGWQTVKWFTKLYDFTQIGMYDGVLLTVYNNMPDRRLLRGYLEKLPFLQIVTTSNNQQVRDLNWDYVTPDNPPVPRQLSLLGYLQNSRTGQQTSIRVDSITNSNPAFTWKWLGDINGADPKEPPTNLGIGINYLLNIYFKPDVYAYYQDILTIHFHGGMKRHIPLYGNTFTVSTEKLLTLLEPAAGSVFAPCEEIVLKWEGHDPTTHVRIYYTTDTGLEWNLIDVVMDSLYVWKIPDLETNFLRFKISQDFISNEVEILSEDWVPIYRANYNQNSTLITTVNVLGKVLTWDLLSPDEPSIIGRHLIEPIPDDAEAKFNSFGIEYSNSDDKFYVGYRNNNLPAFLQGDTIAIFEKSQEFPIKKISLPSGIKAKKLLSDKNKRFISVFPEYGSKILQYSMQTDEFVKEIPLESPIMDIAYNTNADSAAILMINGNIKLVSLDNFAVFDELRFDMFPNFLAIAYSPNGRFLSIGTQSDNSGLKTNIYLIDVPTRRIVKVFNPSAGNPVTLQFNPSSTSLIVGSETDKQIAIYDLTSASPTGSTFGHSGNMTDLKMSPSGFSLVSTSLSSDDNAVYRSFSYPQEDMNSSNLIIRYPEISSDIVKLEPLYLGMKNDININEICNIGISDVDVFEAHFKHANHIRMTKTWDRQVVVAGQCFDFDIEFAPLDTGIIRDTLILYHCSRKYYIPFEAYSIPRNITLLNNELDFGEVCIGDTLTKTFPLFRNDDPVQLIVNSVLIEGSSDNPFRNYINVVDTVLEPGEIFIAKIGFIPKELGMNDADIIIHHSNQTNIYSSSNVKGTGIGSFVELSHETLRFIPEIKVRKLTIKNSGVTDIDFEGFRVVPENIFNVLTEPGFRLGPDEEKIIEIEWNGEDELVAQLIIDANPCLVQRFINLDFYKGKSTVVLPNVTAQAYSEDVEIPVIYENVEIASYEGERFFEADFTVDSKLFLPRSVVSKHGTAQLSENTVKGRIRTFKVRVEGGFPLKDTLCIIKGVAGLSDTDRTPIDLKSGTVGWSKFVEMTTVAGELIIDGICEDRYIIRNNTVLGDMLLIPNPAAELTTLRFELFEDADVNIEIIDNRGFVSQVCLNRKFYAGENYYELNLAGFGTGNYKVKINAAGEQSFMNLIIMR
ncbi:MAG: hypothetical protein WCZ17_00485 [Candidatus Kapaibacterium sp.]